MPKIPLLSKNSSAKTVLKEFPMLEGMTKAEASLMKTMSEDDYRLEEDIAMARAIDILFKRCAEGKYEFPADGEDDEDSGTKVPAEALH